MKTVVFIPARMASMRFPGKMLVPVEMPDGGRVPLIRCVYERAQQAQHAFREFDEDGMDLYVITSDEEIVKEVESWKGQCIWVPEDETHPEIRNGTERCYYALKYLGWESLPKLRVINVQGDEYIHPDMLLQLAKMWNEHKLATLVTPYVMIGNKNRESDVKAVLARNGRIQWFSRTNLPHFTDERRIQGFLHLGIYMYGTKQLKAYIGWDPTAGEQVESLEQLRFLECGETMWGDVTTLPSVGVNVSRDVEVLQNFLRENS